MEFLIAAFLAALALPVVRVLTAEQRRQQHQKLSRGGHLILTDEALTPTRIADALLADDPHLVGVTPFDYERMIRDAELAHLTAQVDAYQRRDTQDAAVQDAAAPAGEALDEQYAITFKPDEPTTFEKFPGQEHIMRPLRAAVAALEPDRRVPAAHVLLTGLPGRGKTLIAKVFGHELQRRARAQGLTPLPYFETFAENLETTADLDAIAQTILDAGGGIWFIDEIHALKHELSTKLFALMEDQKYPFHGSVVATPMPEVLFIGATTDYGQLHPALKRRFGEPYMVRPMTQGQLETLVTNRRFPITADAVRALVERTHWSGAPYEAIWLRNQAEVFARERGRRQITKADVEEVFQVFEIDTLGLRWMDRQVIQALFKVPRFKRGGAEFVCYAASERDLCGMAGLDPEEYREAIKPRLLARRLVEVRSGYGQALTPHGAELYEALKAHS